MAYLETKNLKHQYQDGDQIRVILDSVNLEFEKGKIYSILGYSGAGKTTLLSILAGLDKPNSGEVIVDGKKLSELSLDNYRRNYAATVFQHFNLIDYLSPVDNLLTAMEITDNDMPANIKEVAVNLLDYVGIVSTKASRPVKKLSGGEKQRVAIARALSTNCDIILADEPTGNLDSETEREIIDFLRVLAHEHGKCVIVVTHSDDVAKFTDQVLKLENGSLTEVVLDA